MPEQKWKLARDSVTWPDGWYFAQWCTGRVFPVEIWNDVANQPRFKTHLHGLDPEVRVYLYDKMHLMPMTFPEGP